MVFVAHNPQAAPSEVSPHFLYLGVFYHQVIIILLSCELYFKHDMQMWHDIYLMNFCSLQACCTLSCSQHHGEQPEE